MYTRTHKLPGNYHYSLSGKPRIYEHTFSGKLHRPSGMTSSMRSHPPAGLSASSIYEITRRRTAYQARNLSIAPGKPYALYSLSIRSLLVYMPCRGDQEHPQGGEHGYDVSTYMASAR